MRDETRSLDAYSQNIVSIVSTISRKERRQIEINRTVFLILLSHFGVLTMLTMFSEIPFLKLG